VTRPNPLVGALAVVCVGTLLWCARLILAADLPRGAHVASWGLWALATVAIVTMLAYLREFLHHRQAIGRGASWKPLPSLVLLWIAGATALASFPFILPGPAAAAAAAAAAGAEPSDTASISLTGAGVTSTQRTATSSARTAQDPATTTDTISRSASSRTPVPSSTSSAVSPTSSTASSPTSSARSTTPSTPSSSTTPLIDLDILPTWAWPTTPFGP
jgi:hypothetical protein